MFLDCAMKYPYNNTLSRVLAIIIFDKSCNAKDTCFEKMVFEVWAIFQIFVKK